MVPDEKFNHADVNFTGIFPKAYPCPRASSCLGLLNSVRKPCETGYTGPLCEVRHNELCKLNKIGTFIKGKFYKAGIGFLSRNYSDIMKFLVQSQSVTIDITKCHSVPLFMSHKTVTIL